jgi:hypothetical protein
MRSKMTITTPSTLPTLPIFGRVADGQTITINLDGEPVRLRVRVYTQDGLTVTRVHHIGTPARTIIKATSLAGSSVTPDENTLVAVAESMLDALPHMILNLSQRAGAGTGVWFAVATLRVRDELYLMPTAKEGCLPSGVLLVGEISTRAMVTELVSELNARVISDNVAVKVTSAPKPKRRAKRA